MFENAPHPLDLAYYPSLDDIRNHLYQAKTCTALQLSIFDQQNLKLYSQKIGKQLNHYFRPYKCHNSDEQQCSGVNSNPLQANKFL